MTIKGGKWIIPRMISMNEWTHWEEGRHRFKSTSGKQQKTITTQTKNTTHFSIPVHSRIRYPTHGSSELRHCRTRDWCVRAISSSNCNCICRDNFGSSCQSRHHHYHYNLHNICPTASAPWIFGSRSSSLDLSLLQFSNDDENPWANQWYHCLGHCHLATLVLALVLAATLHAGLQGYRTFLLQLQP